MMSKEKWSYGSFQLILGAVMKSVVGRIVLVLLAGLAVAALSLGCSQPSGTPTTTPDNPAFSEREAIAVVQTWLQRSPVGEDSNCLAMVNRLSTGVASWGARYMGRGEWQVLYAFQSRSGSGGGFTGPGGTWIDPVYTTRDHLKEWRVFEASRSVVPAYGAGETAGRLSRVLEVSGC